MVRFHPLAPRGVEQLVAHLAHNQEVAGSSPASATIAGQRNGYLATLIRWRQWVRLPPIATRPQWHRPVKVCLARALRSRLEVEQTIIRVRFPGCRIGGDGHYLRNNLVGRQPQLPLGRPNTKQSRREKRQILSFIETARGQLAVSSYGGME